MQASLSNRSDWRVSFGVVLTLGWLALAVLYVSTSTGWAEFIRQRAPDLGQFFDGAFAPLAFLWFVVGFFLQHRQLDNNTQVLAEQLNVMRQTVAQAEEQARVIAADELHSRQDTFLRIAEMVSEQLGVTVGWIYMSWAAADPGDGSTIQQRMAPGLELWRAQGSGDVGAFNRECIAMIYGNRVTPQELFWATSIRAGHSESFLSAFDRLLSLADDCDPRSVIRDAIAGGTHGRLYRFIKESRPASM